jgi:hypothetical protein
LQGAVEVALVLVVVERVQAVIGHLLGLQAVGQAQSLLCPSLKERLTQLL